MQKISIANHVQGAIFAHEEQLECSWVVNETWIKHERLELENDLIASHMLMIGEVPAGQFLG